MREWERERERGGGEGEWVRGEGEMKRKRWRSPVMVPKNGEAGLLIAREYRIGTRIIERIIRKSAVIIARSGRGRWNNFHRFCILSYRNPGMIYIHAPLVARELATIIFPRHLALRTSARVCLRLASDTIRTVSDGEIEWQNSEQGIATRVRNARTRFTGDAVNTPRASSSVPLPPPTLLPCRPVRLWKVFIIS